MDRRLRKLARALRGTRRPNPRPKLGYVFIVTYGRSGSTLLLGVLNSLPGYLIRGENRGAVYHLYRFHAACAREQARDRRSAHADDTTRPFFGIRGYRVNKAVADIRRLVVDTLLRPEPDTRVTGFKEIRWYQPDLVEYVEFLREAFPGARFVINTRNLEDVAKSKWWADQPSSVGTLARIERAILELADALGDSAYRVHFDDYVAGPDALRGLIEWLGEEYDATRVAEVLAVRHST